MSSARGLWHDAPESVERFTRWALSQANQAGVAVRIDPREQVPYPNGQSIACSGYFQVEADGQPVLAFATGGRWQDTFPILVHEFAHLTQWREGGAIWTDLYDAEKVEAADRIDRWLGGHEYSPDEVRHMFRAVRAVELDAEKRVLALAAEHRLPIEPVDYAQRANAYVLYYHHVEATRRWRPATQLPPYRDPAVWPHAPTTLRDPEHLPDTLRSAFEAAYGSMRPQPIPPASRLSLDAFDPSVMTVDSPWFKITFHPQHWGLELPYDSGSSASWDISGFMARHPELLAAAGLENLAPDAWPGEVPRAADLFDNHGLLPQEMASAPDWVKQWVGNGTTFHMDIECAGTPTDEVRQERAVEWAQRRADGAEAHATAIPPRRTRRPSS